MSKQVAKVEAAEPPAIAGEEAAYISMIERAARDPSVDITKMERLFEMSERVRARAAESAANASMSAAQAELVPVIRNRKNNQTNSKYTDLAAIEKTAMPVIHKHGFGVICSEFKTDRENHLGIACEIIHARGHSKRYEFHIPWDGTGLKGNANKTATHAYGSTLTYGRRYAICSVFNIATMDDDGNSASKQPPQEEPRITSEQQQELEDAMKAADVDADIILEAYKIKELSELTLVQQQNAIKRCNAKLKATN